MAYSLPPCGRDDGINGKIAPPGLKTMDYV